MRIVVATGLILATAACAQTATQRGSLASAGIAAQPSVPRTKPAKTGAGPSAAQIYENPPKWIGARVRLDCEVIKVSREPANASSSADARCGHGVAASLGDYPSKAATKQYNRALGDQALFVLVGDGVSKLAAGQSATIVGRVGAENARQSGLRTAINVVTLRVDSVE
jgi:hypothetical protein